MAFTPIRSPEKGSIENPICTESVHEQRQLLRRLRFAGGLAVSYERQPPVIGPQRRILDPYRVWPQGDGLWGVDLYPVGAEQGARLLYMELRPSGCAGNQVPPGFTLSAGP